MSAGGAKKHGAHRDLRTCTSHDTPVLYALAGREVRAGQRLSIPGRQFSLHERIPIEKLPQPGPYTSPYCTNNHDQCERKNRGGPRSHPDHLSCHPPSCFSTRLTGVLAQRPPDRRLMASLPARTDTAHTALALTETATPDPVAPAAVRSVKINSNRAQPTDGQTVSPSPPSNQDSDITPVASIGESDVNLNYVESAEKLPTSPADTPDLKGNISEL